MKPGPLLTFGAVTSHIYGSNKSLHKFLKHFWYFLNIIYYTWGNQFFFLDKMWKLIKVKSPKLSGLIFFGVLIYPKELQLN